MAIKPVVFIPGFPASELLLRDGGEKLFPPSVGDVLSPARKQRLLQLLAGPDNPPGSIVAGEPIRSSVRIAGIDLGEQAQALYNILGTYGYTTRGGTDFAPVGWDWRQAVDTDRVDGDVAAAIDRLAQLNGGAKVVVMVHSTGGLVLRRCLELRPELAGKIEQVLSFGIPWAGTLQAVVSVAVGQAIGLFPPIEISADEVRGVMIRCQAAYDLFPPDPEKTDMTGADHTPLDLFMVENQTFQAGPLVNLAWVPGGAAGDAMRVMAADADRRLGRRTSAIELAGAVMPPITNVAGWGFATVTRCTMAAAGGGGGVGGGRSLTFATTPEGDGTVPLVSAAWLRGPGIRTFVLPIGVFAIDQVPRNHSAIWDAPPVRQILDQVLRGAPPAPFVWGAADHDEAVDPHSDVTVRLVATGGDGQPLPNASFTAVGLPQPVTRQLPPGQVRYTLQVPRTNLRPNTGASDLFRFEINVTWDGAAAPASVPIVIHL